MSGGAPAAGPATLVQRTRELAATSPDRLAYAFTDYQAVPQGQELRLTWAQADQRAAALASVLLERGLRGQRAAVLAPQGLDYVVAMLGAFYAGVTAIPLFPPDLPGHGGRLTGILADAAPACVLTTTAAEPGVCALLADAGTAAPPAGATSPSPPPTSRTCSTPRAPPAAPPE